MSFYKVKPRILVTGGSGFIGRHVVDRLLATKVEITSLALPGESLPAAWNGRVEMIEGSVTDSALLQKIVPNNGSVIHLAAIMGAGDYAAHQAVTVEGTRNVLDACLTNNARPLVASSIVVFGDHIRTQICDDTTPHGKQLGPYVHAKQQQEQLVKAYRERGLPGIIIRPANVWGPGSLPWVDVVIAALQAGAPIIVDDGAGNAGLVHVDNLADAVIALVDEPMADNGTYTICDEDGVTWKEYFSDIARMIDAQLPSTTDFEELWTISRQFEAPENFVAPETYQSIPLATLMLIGSSNRFDSGALRKLTGWSPKLAYRDGIEQLRNVLKTQYTGRRGIF